MGWSLQGNWALETGTEQQSVHWEDLRKLCWSLLSFKYVWEGFNPDLWSASNVVYDDGAYYNYFKGNVVAYNGEVFVARNDIPYLNGNNNPPRWRDYNGNFDASNW